MRNALIAGALLLAGCSTAQAPIDQAQLQRDLATAVLALQAAGCATSAIAEAAAPIVAIAADADGGRVLEVIGATGARLCAVRAPAVVTAPAGTTLGAVIAAP